MINKKLKMKNTRHFLAIHFKILSNSCNANFFDFLLLIAIKFFSVKDKNVIIIFITVDIIAEYNI